MPPVDNPATEKIIFICVRLLPWRSFMPMDTSAMNLNPESGA